MRFRVTMGRTTTPTPIPIIPVGGTTLTSLGGTTNLTKAKEVGNPNSKTSKTITTKGMVTGNSNRTTKIPETEEWGTTNQVGQTNRLSPTLRP